MSILSPRLSAEVTRRGKLRNGNTSSASINNAVYMYSIRRGVNVTRNVIIWNPRRLVQNGDLIRETKKEGEERKRFFAIKRERIRHTDAVRRDSAPAIKRRGHNCQRF